RTYSPYSSRTSNLPISFYMRSPPHCSTLFPYTTLFRSIQVGFFVVIDNLITVGIVVPDTDLTIQTVFFGTTATIVIVNNGQQLFRNKRVAFFWVIYVGIKGVQIA